MVGRRREGWAKLDVSADGFWNSFLAIPAALPALMVTWASHGRFLMDGGAVVSPAALVISLALIELAIWLLTLALFAGAARPLGWADRTVPGIIALNWGSVPIAYARAVPAAMIVVLGMGPGLAFVMLVVEAIILVAYWRLLAAALERPALVVTGVFLASLVVGFALSDWGHGLFGLLPAPASPA